MSFHTGLLDSLGVKILRLVTDSREVETGDTFVAYPGAAADGRQFIAQAIANGANAVIWEAEKFSWNAGWQVPNLAVHDLRHHAGEIADYIYGAPSKKLWMVGVTGTNGKTSCSHWLAQSFGALGKKTALLGTLGNGFFGALQPTLNTTPDAIRLHGLLAEYVQQGAQGAVMEVSSHALAQGRVNGVKYDVALLTNLSRDHLDYHGDMDNYAAAKRRLFDWPQLKHAVLNLDDEFGFDLAGKLQASGVEITGYGLNEAALMHAEQNGMRMVYCGDLKMTQSGLDLQLHTSWGAARLESRLVGRFNASNLLGALAVLLVSGVELADAVAALARVQAAPGRMQALGGGNRPAVVIDYAHTPDALQKVLQSLREAKGAGRLVCVFGCGGDRDRGKRPMMGQVAAKLADVCIVTNDNPRSEDPAEIIAAIVSGMTGSPLRIIEDRAAAIGVAIREAQAADTVLLAGKGHEDYQEICGVKHPFSDLEVAQRALAAWRAQA
ncbi:MAG TPA: UDP-N-acetylmuramoyl-L-alanyl-D-glutamate--2,6-diaminopimelate ligase [Gallionellaceae bacterium]